MQLLLFELEVFCHLPNSVCWRDERANTTLWYVDLFADP